MTYFFNYTLVMNLWFPLALGLGLLAWRLWRFTLLPRKQPLEPKELPYWIPYIGHVWSFFNDFNGALLDARKYYGDSREPYSVYLAGRRLYICTSPDDVATLYRNTTTVAFHSVIEDMYRWIGMSEDGFEKMFAVDLEAPHNRGAPQAHAPAHMINEFHRLQTKPGEHFDNLLHKRTLPEFDKSLRSLSDGSSPAIVSQSKDGMTVSLLQLCMSSFLSAMTTAFLGHKIWDVSPHLLDYFMVWERSNWKYLFQMPDILSRDMLGARDDIVNSFVRYLEVPESERPDRNFFIKSVEEMMRHAGCNNQDMGKTFLLHFWAIQGNIYKVGFWTLAYLVHDPSLLEQIRTEVAPAVTEDGELDESYLAEKCPLLDSLISEILRLTIAAALVRDIVEPTQVGSKVLQPGNKVLVPYHQLHLDRSVWGAEPLAFSPARFADNPKLLSSKAYRPFGGGKTLCPGRFFGRRFLGYATASILTRFDLRLADNKRSSGGRKGKDAGGLLPPGFPRINHTKPSPGASPPAQGEDVFVILQDKRREKKSGGA